MICRETIDCGQQSPTVYTKIDKNKQKKNIVQAIKFYKKYKTLQRFVRKVFPHINIALKKT